MDNPMRGMSLFFPAIIIAAQISVASALAEPAAAPSFNCAKASTLVEAAICADPMLAELDVRLAAVFAQAVQQAAPVEKHDIVVNQRSWLKQRDTGCKDKEQMQSCLKRQYFQRWNELNDFVSAAAAGDVEIMFNGGPIRAYRNDPATGPSDFNNSIRSKGIDGSVISCSVVMSVPLTRYETGYGGACVLQDSKGKRRNILVCTDTGVGRFNLVPAGSQAVSKHDLAQFTADNCTGG